MSQLASQSAAWNLVDAIREVDRSPAVASAEMESSSIPSAWLLSGDARTRSKLLGKTEDKLAFVMLWECGPANFKWHYGKDEFLIILSGDAYLQEESGRERHYGPSDVAFFPAGSTATWRIPDHVRKVAILKRQVSQPLAFACRAWMKFLEVTKLSDEPGL